MIEKLKKALEKRKRKGQANNIRPYTNYRDLDDKNILLISDMNSLASSLLDVRHKPSHHDSYDSCRDTSSSYNSYNDD